MKYLTFVVAMGIAMVASGAEVPPAPNGVPFPKGYADWRVIAPAHRTDNNTLRAVLGNDVAIAAAREGRTNPWPDGAILAKVVWKDATHENFPSATIPGTFVHAEFMVKDTKKYANTGGWGFGRWLGNEQKPYGKDAGFAQECIACHTPVKHQDLVFTRPAAFPR